jgi:GNAT superfamily N-acetyltransferase
MSDYEISSERERMDVGAIHAFLTRTYWARGIPLETVQRAIDHSLCFGVFHGPAQVGFARVITDQATFAYLADVYLLDEHRGKGLARRLVQAVLAHPRLQGLRRWLLVTRDAHALYRPHGFEPVAHPDRIMEIHRPDAYLLPGRPLP